jgi:trans-aconitate methyltransferase
MAQKIEPKRLLDFPCGHGRALRHFRAAWPDATIYAGDINDEGADFCRSQFGAEVFPADIQFRKIQFPRLLDLIWCESLITHLDEQRSKQLIMMLVDSLAPGGCAPVHYPWPILSSLRPNRDADNRPPSLG